MTGRSQVSATDDAGVAGATPAPSPVAWYLGRDGQQYGPVSDGDFKRLLETGQLLPTDLVWREGFVEWQTVASMQAAATVAPAVPPVVAPAASVAVRGERDHQVARQDAARDRGEHLRDRGDDARHGSVRPNRGARAQATQTSAEKPRRKRSFLRGVAWVAICAFFAVTLGAAYLVVAGDRNLLMMAKAIIPSGNLATAPIGGFAASREETDAGMQKSRLWQVLKADFPDWYDERVREATEAKRANKSDKEIATSMMQAVVALRRKYAGDATAASFVKLKAVAMQFSVNLTRLRGESIDTCYQFVSAGEGAPAVVALLQSADHTSPLQAQLIAIFDAIAEGRRNPRVYPAPKAEDYDALVSILEARGWKNNDMQLFSDSAALAKASPETVCRLVTEWFESQLKVQDQEAQLRLIVDSLRPVVGG